MNTTSYLPGQGLFNFVSEYITEEAPSPAPAPSPVAPSPSPTPAPDPEPVIIAEPVNSRNLWLENDKLKEEVQSMKQEMKVLKSMCGLDRRLKLTKIKEEDLHKYCQYDIKKQSPKYGKEEFSLTLINKTRYDLEPTMKNDYTGYKYNSYHGVIPINFTMRFSMNEQHYLHPSQGPQYNIIIKPSLVGDWVTPPMDLIQNINGYTQFNSLNNDIDEYYLMNITFLLTIDYF